MGKQLERGTQFPMRPSTISTVIAADFTVPNDATPDWTTGAQKLTVAKGHDHMEDFAPAFVITNGDLTVRPGQYEIRLYVYIKNTTGGAEDCKFVVTDTAGTTLYYESPTLTIPANATYFHKATVFAHLSAAGYNALRFQAAQTSGAGTDLQILTIPAGDPGVRGPLAIVHKIGNVNET